MESQKMESDKTQKNDANDNNYQATGSDDEAITEEGPQLPPPTPNPSPRHRRSNARDYTMDLELNPDLFSSLQENVQAESKSIAEIEAQLCALGPVLTHLQQAQDRARAQRENETAEELAASALMSMRNTEDPPTNETPEKKSNFKY